MNSFTFELFYSLDEPQDNLLSLNFLMDHSILAYSYPNQLMYKTVSFPSKTHEGVSSITFEGLTVTHTSFSNKTVAFGFQSG